jgi:hypothetical protein
MFNQIIEEIFCIAISDELVDLHKNVLEKRSFSLNTKINKKTVTKMTNIP